MIYNIVWLPHCTILCVEVSPIGHTLKIMNSPPTVGSKEI